jgi:hypothetical protein
MNDMQLLTRFRSEVPVREPSPRAEHLLLAELQEAGPVQAAGSGRRRTGRPARYLAGTGTGTRAQARARRLAVACGLAVAAAAGLLVAQAIPAGHSPSVATASAAELAEHAAAAAAAQPAYPAGQWFYEREESDLPRLAAQYPRGDASRNWTMQYWRTAGPSGGLLVREAWLDHGRLTFTGASNWPPGAIAYQDLGTLPASPRALIDYLAHRHGSPVLLGPWFNTTTFASSPAPARVFWSIGSILTSFIPGPRLATELYRALGLLPGVRVDRGATDIAGRPGVAFVLVTGPTRLEIILNLHDFGFMGLTYLSPVSPSGRQGFAILQQVPVAGPGVRP